MIAQNCWSRGREILTSSLEIHSPIVVEFPNTLICHLESTQQCLALDPPCLLNVYIFQTPELVPKTLFFVSQSELMISPGLFSQSWSSLRPSLTTIWLFSQSEYSYIEPGLLPVQNKRLSWRQVIKLGQSPSELSLLISRIVTLTF